MAEPTKGLRLNVLYMEDDSTVVTTQGYQGDAQATVDVTYINWLIETDEKRREHLSKQAAGAQDILVDMGDMTQASLDQVVLDADYESMTEDIIQNVNHIILQGIAPMTALYSMSQAFAIVLGYALRANLPWPMAQAILTQVMKSAQAAEKMVRIITKQ
jgi:16S rRNA A1518/A1519 N6-dimethyltransferase RsmA/KsgA/DIM1 with predicted DNA glycosylase/AP lyase activity